MRPAKYAAAKFSATARAFSPSADREGASGAELSAVVSEGWTVGADVVSFAVSLEPELTAAVSVGADSGEEQPVRGPAASAAARVQARSGCLREFVVPVKNDFFHFVI